MVALAEAFKKLTLRHIAVAGDLCIDRYTYGKVDRISPEAPVAIVQAGSEEEKAGCAGNVMLNLVSLGAHVRAIGRLGKDSGGDALKKILLNEKIELTGLVIEESWTTPIKQRVIAAGQQVVRIDYEKVTPLNAELEATLIEAVPHLLEGVDALALSDYGKGALTPALLAALIKEGRRRALPIIADPKGTDFTRYRGSTVLKPNLKEAYAAAALSLNASLNSVAERLHRDSDLAVLMVTRSEEGISLFYPQGESEHFPVKALQVRDVTGAGDTVLAVAAFALANGLSYSEATLLANKAASLAVEQFGCARISLSMLAERILQP